MIRSVIVFLIMLSASTSFGQVELALGGPQWEGARSYEVKGRYGILIKQKLTFGPYRSTTVKRSWTKEYSVFQGVGNLDANSDYRNMIGVEYVQRNQTLFFTLQDSSGNAADVQCVTNYKADNIILGNSGITLTGILGNGGKGASSVYYAQIYASAEGAPWHLALDNAAAEESPRTYETRLARSKEEYYIIKPYRTVKSKKGKIIDLTFGFAGFQIRRKNGDAVAAVSTINKGVVYLRDIPAEEKIILSAACAAILLQDEIVGEAEE
jgi:hypothetical protein